MDTNVAPAVEKMNHCPRILTLDGGGIRGLSSLLILREIMDEIERQTGSTPLPCQYFDLIGGTSTGGLIAIMLGRLRMCVDCCIENYIKFAEKVFSIDRVIAGVPVGDDGCRFDATILENVIKEIVEGSQGNREATMAESPQSDTFNPCPTFVVTTNSAAADGRPVLFRSYQAKGVNADQCAIWQAARATTAAPSFFRPMVINVRPPACVYTDGGLTHNNPSELALKEVERIWPDVKKVYLVSIGTGKQRNVEVADVDSVAANPSQLSGFRYFMSFIGRFSTIKWITQAASAAIGVMELKKIAKACVKLTTNSELVHQRLLDRAKASDSVIKTYYRFNVERGLDDIGLQEWRRQCKLGQITQSYMMEEERIMIRDACVMDLMKPATAGCSILVDRLN